MNKAWFGLVAAVIAIGTVSTAEAAKPAKTAPAASARAAKTAVAKTAASAAPRDDEADEHDDPSKDLEALPPRERKIIETERTMTWESGPKKLTLPCGASVDLPSGYRYLDVPQATKLRAAYGNTHADGTQGIIEADSSDHDWRVYLSYEESGYVKDDEKIDANELKALREGQDDANKERVQLGHPALRIGQWSEPPRYDHAKHHLVWGLHVLVDSTGVDSINYNTRILGRRGYISLNLVTGAEDIAKFVPEVDRLLGVTTFDDGARYSDFSDKTDKIAEYGLGGLILGGAGLGAAKIAGKVGIIALLAKGGKGILVILLAPFMAIKKWLNRGKSAPGGT